MAGTTQGITVFASLMHSHLLGRVMRVRHFRQGVELPLLSEDNNYDFNYQDTRMLRKEVQILAVSITKFDQLQIFRKMDIFFLRIVLTELNAFKHRTLVVFSYQFYTSDVILGSCYLKHIKLLHFLANYAGQKV